MNEINLPFHLIIPILISMLILGIFFKKRKQLFRNGKWQWVWISLTVFFVLYLLTVGVATYSDIYAQWNLNTFDLDGDGLFGEEERTNEQKAAMQYLINDTGRNFSFITGFIFSGMIAFFVFALGKTIEVIVTVKK
ncbi:MAG: hypothetical protein AB8B69_06790 [Chitinophagales bacterium]